MAKFKIALNLAVPDNYVFFDPVTGLHLSRGNSSGYVSKLSPSILRGLRGNTLLDIDGMVNIEKGELIVEAPKVEASKVEVPVAEAPTVDEENKVDEVKEKKTTSRKK